MSQESRVARFLHYLRDDGLFSAIRISFLYLRSRRRKFKWKYGKRSLIYIWFVWLKIRVLQILGSDTVTDADPFKIIWVAPDDIQSGVDTAYSYEWGKVAPLNFERIPVHEQEQYQVLAQLYADGIPSLENENRKRRQVAKSMKNEGYIPQRELRKPESVIPFHYRDFEIAVHIGANGELYWAGWGRNRLCLAKILQVEEIAVQPRTRHPEWQNKRDTIREAQSVDELGNSVDLDHPDLQDVM